MFLKLIEKKIIIVSGIGDNRNILYYVEKLFYFLHDNQLEMGHVSLLRMNEEL